MLKIVLIAVGIAVVGCIPFMGIPGYIVLLVAQPATNVIYGPLAWEAWMGGLGDRAWPLVIMLAIIWPVFIPIAYFLNSKLFPAGPLSGFKQAIIFTTVIVGGMVALGQIAIIMSGTVKRLTHSELVEAAVASGSLEKLQKFYRPEDLGTLRKDPLIDAIFDRKNKIAEFFIKQRSMVDQYSPPGGQESSQFASPLHTAVNVGSVELVKLLLEKGANPNQANSLRQTPLFAISWDPEGNADVVRLLKKYGADFTAIDEEGNTPLISMTKHVLNSWVQMSDYAAIMIEAGVKVDHQNNEGMSALDYAKKNHHTTVVALLEN